MGGKLLIGVSRLIRVDECGSDMVLTNVRVGWAKFMEWKYPVEVVVTSPVAFRGAGAVEAAASL